MAPINRSPVNKKTGMSKGSSVTEQTDNADTYRNETDNSEINNQQRQTRADTKKRKIEAMNEQADCQTDSSDINTNATEMERILDKLCEMNDKITEIQKTNEELKQNPK